MEECDRARKHFHLVIVLTSKRDRENETNYAAMKHLCWTGVNPNAREGGKVNPDYIAPVQHVTYELAGDQKKAMSGVTKAMIQAVSLGANSALFCLFFSCVVSSYYYCFNPGISPVIICFKY